MAYCPSLSCWQVSPCIQCDDISQRVERLFAFLKARGAVLEGVKLASAGEAGLGVFTTASSSPRVVIPSSAWLNGAAVLRDPMLGSPLRSLMMNLLQQDIQLSSRQLVMCFLVIVRNLQSIIKTDWSAYVNLLPRTVDLPTSWEEGSDELNLLEGTELEPAIAAQRHSLQMEYEVLRPFLIDLFEASEEWFTLSGWVWADAIHWSRVLPVSQAWEEANSQTPIELYPNTPPSLWAESLVPFIDFMNHSSTPSSRWSLIPFSGAAAIDLVSQGDMKQEGSELTISYGDKPNAEFLFHYGFVPWTAQQDSVGLPFPVHSEEHHQLTQHSPVFRVRLPPPNCDDEGQVLVAGEDSLDILRYCLANTGESPLEYTLKLIEELLLQRGKKEPITTATATANRSAGLSIGLSTVRMEHVARYLNAQQTILEGVAACLRGRLG